MWEVFLVIIRIFECARIFKANCCLKIHDAPLKLPSPISGFLANSIQTYLKKIVKVISDKNSFHIYVMPTRRLEVNVSTVRFTITRASITEARRCYNYKTQSPPIPKGGGGARAI